MTGRGSADAPDSPACQAPHWGLAMRLRRPFVVVLAGLLGLTAAAVLPAQGAGTVPTVHLLAAGDFNQTAASAAVFDAMKVAAPDAALALGDLSYRSTPEELWCDYAVSHLGAGFPFELVSGNHESNGLNGNINNFSSCLPNQLPGLVGTYGRQYYVDVPRGAPLVRVVMISPNLPYPDGVWSYAAGTPRYSWTAAAIDGARAAGVPWVVVGMHEPCLSMGAYGCGVGSDLMNLLAAKRVDLVLTGHEHGYQRTKQLATSTACPAIPVGVVGATCIVDSGDALAAGAGTVFATVGTGGTPLRPMDPADSEAGYFRSYSGSTTDPAYGFLDVSATADRLDARFVPVLGATFADAFSLTKGIAPPNQPPVAAFTAISTGLTSQLDSTGSTDSDGVIASYAWDFGDSSTGTGPSPSHAYASAGTYQVSLTVTDNDGATATVVHGVTVTAPGQLDPFVVDSFGRTVAAGLGSADLGGAWTTTGGTTDYSVSGGAGVLNLRAGRTLNAYLGATTRTDTDLRLSLALDKVPVGGPAYLTIEGRRVATNNEYGGRVRVSPTGAVTVQLTALKGSSTVVVLQPEVTLPGVTYTAGSKLAVRLQVTGTNPTTVRMKAWPAGTTEPVAWQRSVTDTAATLQVPGSVGILPYLSSAASNAPVPLRMIELSATPTAP